MRCSKCGTENPDRARFCVECAAPFPRRCPSCGAENPPTAEFCLECAKPLDKSKSESPKVGQSTTSPIHVRDPAADVALEGERKTVTALFVDIKGSTELMRDLDPEEARAIVDPAIRLMIDAAHCYNGYVVDQRRDFCTVRSGGCVVRSPRLMLGYRGATFGSFVAITRTHGGISDGNHFNRRMRLRRNPL
jgi:hypothetical protein